MPSVMVALPCITDKGLSVTSFNDTIKLAVVGQPGFCETGQVKVLVSGQKITQYQYMRPAEMWQAE